MRYTHQERARRDGRGRAYPVQDHTRRRGGVTAHAGVGESNTGDDDGGGASVGRKLQTTRKHKVIRKRQLRLAAMGRKLCNYL